eukprot:358570_1
MTEFRRQRVLNPIQHSHCIPSSASKTSNDSEMSGKSKKKKRKKIIIESETDIDDLMNVDPRRLSLDEHPLIVKSKCNTSIYSQQIMEKEDHETNTLTSILDGLLTTTSDKENDNDQPM